MATVNVIKHKRQNSGTMGRVLKYVMREDKTLHQGEHLITGQDCCPETAFLEFMTTKQIHKKADGMFFYHFVQSFHPEENVTPKEANAIALELAKQFDGFEVLVATHVDAGHIHSHLVVNSVSHITGKKLHQNRENLMEHRRKSDEICLAHGLSVLPQEDQQHSAESIRPREYRAALKGDSWKFRLINAIDFCMGRCRNKKDFILEMKQLGYEVSWTSGRKSITYTCPNGMKCRDKRLHDEKYLKENMEVEFGLREAQIEQSAGTLQTGQALSVGSLRSAAGTMGSPSDFAPEQSSPASRGVTSSEASRQPEQPAPAFTENANGAERFIETGWEKLRRDLQAVSGTGTVRQGGYGGRTKEAPSMDDEGISLLDSIARLAGNLSDITAETEHQSQHDHRGWSIEQR